MTEIFGILIISPSLHSCNESFSFYMPLEIWYVKSMISHLSSLLCVKGDLNSSQ